MPSSVDFFETRGFGFSKMERTSCYKIMMICGVCPCLLIVFQIPCTAIVNSWGECEQSREG